MADLSIIISGAVSPSLTQGLNQVSQQLAQTALMGDRLGGSSAAAVSGLNSINGAAFTARQGVQDLSNVFRDLPFAINNPAIGANALEHVAGIFNTLQQETGSLKGALSALGASITGGGGLLIGFSLLTAAYSLWAGHSKEAEKSSDDAAKAAQQAADAAKAAAASEFASVSKLIDAANNRNLTLAQQKDIIEKLQNTNKAYFGDLKIENGLIVGLSEAYANYANNIFNVAKAKGAEDQVKSLSTQLVDVTGKVNDLTNKLNPESLTFKGLTAANQMGGVEQAFKNIQTALNGVFLTQEQIQQISAITGKSETQINQIFNDRSKLRTQELQLVGQISSLSQFINSQEGDGLKTQTEKKDKIDQVAEALRKLKIAQKEVNNNPLLTFSEKDKQNFDLVNGAIKQLLDLKVKATDPIILKLKVELSGLATDINFDKIHDQIAKTIKDAEPIEVPVELSTLFPKGGLKSGLDEIIKSQLEELSDYTLQEGTDIFKIKFKGKALINLLNLLGDPKDFQKEAKQYADAAAKQAAIIADTVANAIDTVAQDIGAGKSLKGIFSDIGNVIGEGLKELGKQIIADAVLIKGIKEALDTAFGGNALAGVALGFALEFAGSAIEAKLPKFAQGGIAYGPTVGIFGEAGPEAIVPLNKLPDIISKSGINNGGMTTRVVVEGQISGGNIRLSQQRTQQSFERRYGVRGK